MASLVPFHGDSFACDEACQIFSRGIAEGLAFLRGVNALKPDAVLGVTLRTNDSARAPTMPYYLTPKQDDFNQELQICIAEALTDTLTTESDAWREQ